MDKKYDQDNKVLPNGAIHNLADLKPGESAIIYGITPDCDNNIRQRLLDLGFVNGASVNVQNISPMGNPVAYCIHETLIALRNEDARYIRVINNEEIIENAERRL